MVSHISPNPDLRCSKHINALDFYCQNGLFELDQIDSLHTYLEVLFTWSNLPLNFSLLMGSVMASLLGWAGLAVLEASLKSWSPSQLWFLRPVLAHPKLGNLGCYQLLQSFTISFPVTAWMPRCRLSDLKPHNFRQKLTYRAALADLLLEPLIVILMSQKFCSS